ncbi:hypothetical protein GNI_155860 [Gregarina niphandrodes]|uniref:Uncharacterized protein n=1 Tax=Gregarina niphandrodes TaxID=110365 RepID=A0A023AZ65_GRENI|nr:hypothetical protein GNI_155860 [Gregarina niphandrodes]EZG43944.1 hypothetical protein GNI_155860 [Gregarina niphandrodes]|eukprot:XP_011132915.1 hypothetical protein GNI_155860 [Gregarina niphandrodes]
MFKILAAVSTVVLAQTSVDCVAYYTLNQASLVDPSQIKYCVAQCTEMPTVGTCPAGSPVTDCVRSLDACKFIEEGEAAEGGDGEESATEGEKAEDEVVIGTEAENAGADAGGPKTTGATMNVLIGSAVVLSLVM